MRKVLALIALAFVLTGIYCLNIYVDIDSKFLNVWKNIKKKELVRYSTSEAEPRAANETSTQIFPFHEEEEKKNNFQTPQKSENLSETNHRRNENNVLNVSSDQTIEDMLQQALHKASKEVYTIVVWTFDAHPAKPRFSVDPQICGSCKFTFNQSETNNPLTKAVLFNFNAAMFNMSMLPTDRRVDQLYIWRSRESPPSLRISRGMTLKEWNNYFNLTMTYRRDSSVADPFDTAASVLRYWKGVQSGKSSQVIMETLLSKKSNLAVWIVSNCKSSRDANRRLNYVDDLIAAGLSLDRFGKCFGKILPFKISNGWDIISQYKFYMSFENSRHCRDYITEKVYRNAFRMGAVPVVLGATKSDYEAVLPPGSFIFVEDFATPRDLSEYLKYLDKNETAYKEYFKWRFMKIEDIPQYKKVTGFCQLCRILHGINIDEIYKPNYNDMKSSIPLFGYPNQPRVISSLREWFYGSDSRDCLQTY